MVMINSLLSLFYYLRWFGPALARSGERDRQIPRTGEVAAWPAVTAVVAATASVGLGVGAGLLWSALADSLML